MRSARVAPGALAADAAHSPYSSIVITRSSIRQRVGAQLKLDDERAGQRLLGSARGAGGRCVDSLDVERRAVARGRPQAAALPAGLWIIDAALQSLGEK